MHAFGISGIVAYVGGEEGEERSNYVSVKSQAGEGRVDNISSSDEVLSCQSEDWLQMPCWVELG